MGFRRMTHRVLAVDDSLLMHRKIQKSLKGSEFELVGSAKDGEEALKLYGELSPDAVLLDIVMPKMSGKETLKALLEADPAARVIMVSSLGTHDTVTECLQAGALRFIQKPFQRTHLLEALRSVLSE